MAVRVPVHAGGHSQGGMVVTAALEQITGRVRELVCLDAFVPADGDCVAQGATSTSRTSRRKRRTIPSNSSGRSRFG